MKTSDLIKRLDTRYDVMTLKREWQVLKEHVDTIDLSNVQQIGLTHTKDCKDRTTNGFRHDNCFCECHDKGKYDSSNEPKD